MTIKIEEKIIELEYGGELIENITGVGTRFWIKGQYIDDADGFLGRTAIETGYKPGQKVKYKITLESVD